MYLLPSALYEFMFELFEFGSCLLHSGFSGLEGRADVDKVVIHDDLIIYMESLDS